MANKGGTLYKLKLCWMFLKNTKNLLTVTCEICNSINITVSDKTSFARGNQKIYKAKYTCHNCKATGEVEQVWNATH